MQIYNRALRRVRTNHPRLYQCRRLAAGALAPLAVAVVFAAAHYRRPLQPPVPAVTAGSQTECLPPPPGLSHARKDFDKALGLLTEAAAKDPRMAAYSTGVQARVKGNSPVPEAALALPTPSSAAALTPGISAGKESPDNLSRKEPVAGEPVAGTGDSSRTNSAVARWISYYTTSLRGRRTMAVGLERSTAYVALAREEFRKAGVPEDLVWLAQVESVWNPCAVSPAAAGGIWQFIPKTAAEYGLTVEAGNDERADPLKQTRAAAAYLRDLHTIFGDWGLAMAAYNSGESRVMAAVIKNGRANFWELYEKRLLPKETCDYVPKIMAAIEIADHLEAYNFNAPSVAFQYPAAGELQ